MNGAARRARSVIFRVAAGPRCGFGHLVRCRSLAAALGVEPRVSIRGTPATRATAVTFGWTVLDVDSDRRLLSMNPALLVVDDPSAAATHVWGRRARRLGIPVATIHDLGRGYAASDLIVDGSVLARRRWPGTEALLGPDYAILHPAFATRGHDSARSSRRVLIALGGGAHVWRLARQLCREVARLAPHADIRVARGFVSRRQRALPAGRWVKAPDGLAAELSRAAAAIVAGGITLYEACALGVPVVGLALTVDQQRTVRALARRGAAIDARGSSAPLGTVPFLSPSGPRRISRAAAGIAGLLGDESLRRRQSTAARDLVDGRGAIRVASRLQQLIHGRKAARAA
jgi:spore coat polysaccharide biosynthesis predicted glycosyltransferase SpsG